MDLAEFICKFVPMKAAGSYIGEKRLVISVLCTFFITYPNVMWIPWNLSQLEPDGEVTFWATFVYRCAFFCLLFYHQIGFNFSRMDDCGFVSRFGRNLVFTVVAGLLFLAISYMVPPLGIQSGTVGKHLTFQFLVVCLLCTFIGYVSELNDIRQRKELEIERLKIENLQSRCNALINQINPHFFFNSLNGISSLVRRGDEDVTLDYITRLSDIFRYILQGDRKRLVTLDDEIRFVRSFAYVMEVRYGDRLKFKIDVPEEYLQLRLPVLSLLPLLENVTVHNRIDSSHQMAVSIGITDRSVAVSNNIYPKLTPPDSNATGLDNLNNRFQLMTGNSIRIESDETVFKVYLPLMDA